MPNKESQHISLPEPSRRLDLHGCTKSDALRLTTDFLERSQKSNKTGEALFVLIITGSGAHSSDGRKFRFFNCSQ